MTWRDSVQPSAYAELVHALGELRATGEKGHRHLLAAVLPRLAQMESLPASLVPQLLQVKGAGDDRCCLEGDTQPSPACLLWLLAWAGQEQQ